MLMPRVRVPTNLGKERVREVGYSITLPHKVQSLNRCEVQPEVTIAGGHSYQQFLGVLTTGQENIMDKTGQMLLRGFD